MSSPDADPAPAPKLTNPYEEEIQDPPLPFGRTFALAASLFFLAILVLPPAFRHAAELAKPGPDRWLPVARFFEFPSKEARDLLAAKQETNPRITRTTPNFIEHREAWEKRLEDDDPFAALPRRWMQTALTAVFREGNRQTVVGRDGWLFFRPAIDSVTGFGPIRPEPDSVAKDPNRSPWSGPLDVILAFRNQLAEQDVELILVPIPVKPMILPDQLGARVSPPLLHPDAETFYSRLREGGVDVVDLAPSFVAWRTKTEVFLKQDTHWTPDGMARTAKLLADHVRAKPWFTELPSEPARFAVEPLEIAHHGDLAEKLDGVAFPLESVTIGRVRDSRTGEFVSIRDQDAPLVLLGDSFTNIFAQEDLNWGTHAGFAEHLAKELGMSLDTIALNGQASTGVRKAFADRPGAREGKKAVLWAIAARDLFLSETVARETNVAWSPVTFRAGSKPAPAPPQDEALVIEAELLATSRLANPKTAPYDSTLLATKYRVLKVVEGTYDEDAILVWHWGFRNRELSPAAAYQPGIRQRLRLAPLDTQADLQSLNRTDTLDEFDLIDSYWAEAAEPLP